MVVSHMIPGRLALLLALPLLAACASDDGADGQTPAQMAANGGNGIEASDPLEPVNRAVFFVNEALDVALLGPLAELYRVVVPEPGRNGVRNALRNLRAPLDLANQTLQGDWAGARDVVVRFSVNTTVGLGGLIDVADGWGYPYEFESFDQTLAYWGVPSGPYIVLPLLGSSTLRDAVGVGVEQFGDPVSIYATNNEAEWFNRSRTGLSIVSFRADVIEPVNDLRRNSVDYYAARRALYFQQFNDNVRDGAADPSQFPEIPDFDDPAAGSPAPGR